jgi:hypothetical protein
MSCLREFICGMARLPERRALGSKRRAWWKLPQTVREGQPNIMEGSFDVTLPRLPYRYLAHSCRCFSEAVRNDRTRRKSLLSSIEKSRGTGSLFKSCLFHSRPMLQVGDLVFLGCGARDKSDVARATQGGACGSWLDPCFLQIRTRVLDRAMKPDLPQASQEGHVAIYIMRCLSHVTPYMSLFERFDEVKRALQGFLIRRDYRYDHGFRVATGRIPTSAHSGAAHVVSGS